MIANIMTLESIRAAPRALAPALAETVAVDMVVYSQETQMAGGECRPPTEVTMRPTLPRQNCKDRMAGARRYRAFFHQDLTVPGDVAGPAKMARERIQGAREAPRWSSCSQTA